MKPDKNGNKNQQLDARYQNGQSDVEKLMRRHLQEPGHVLSDEDLKNLNVAQTPVAATPLPPETRAELNEVDKDLKSGDDSAARIITPLNVLGS